MMSKPLNLFHRGKSIDCASSAYISRKFGEKKLLQFTCNNCDERQKTSNCFKNVYYSLKIISNAFFLMFQVSSKLFTA